MTLLGPHHRGKASVHALVLAAGLGSRFGGGKLHALYRGQALLAHGLTQVESACAAGLLDGGHVVVSAHDHRALLLVRQAGLMPIVNDAPHLGLSQSLRLGLETLQDIEGSAAAVVFLGDQPHVRLEVVEQLVAAWRGGRGAIIRPRYSAQPDSPGHPVLLYRTMWHQASRLEGDTGFGGLPPGSGEVVLIDVCGDNPDVDTRADLQALEGRGVEASNPVPLS